MTKPTHYADISDTTIWRVWFTPPAGLTGDALNEWLAENWADSDMPEIRKDVYDDGGTEVIFVSPMPEDKQ